jgi:redox-sensitive bicupin YhaK (pirin superfamily)
LISRIDLDKEHTFEYTLKSKNHGVYVMTIQGNVVVDNQILETRDAAGVSETDSFLIAPNEDSSLLFIEVPMNF